MEQRSSPNVGPTPREQFQEKKRKAGTSSKKKRNKRNGLDHYAADEMIVERSEEVKPFDCWRCNASKMSRSLCVWNVRPRSEDAELAGDVPKTICLGCYGELLSKRKGRGPGAVVGEDLFQHEPTLRQPHPHKRREKQHAKVSYVVPKGQQQGRPDERALP